jgi:hypothetical protein
MADASREEDPHPSTEHESRESNPDETTAHESPGGLHFSWNSLPIYVGIAAILAGFCLIKPTTIQGINTSSYEICATTLNYGLPIAAIISQATRHSKRAWEVAALFEAKMEIYDPDRSVFGRTPFPDERPPSLGLRMDEASLYIINLIDVKGESLYPDEDSTTSPAALGVAALMIGQSWKTHLEAASKQKDSLLSGSRYHNGAISSSADRLEVAARAVGQFAPFLAYYGVAHQDPESIHEAVRQIEYHRDALFVSDISKKGLWKNVVAPSDYSDARLSSVSNAIAALGMLQVRSIIASWPNSNSSMRAEIDLLDKYVYEVLNTAQSDRDEESGLLREYFYDETSRLITSSTSLLAAVAYRLATITQDATNLDRILHWAHKARRRVFQHVDSDGILIPASSRASGVPRNGVEVDAEAQSYLLMLAAAWRDCVCKGLCLDVYRSETETS